MAAEFSSLLKSFSTGFLVTRSPEGLLHGRPMHVASAEESGNIWFVTNIKSPKCEDIRQHPLEVLVTFQEGNKYLSITGTAELYGANHRELIQRLWQEAFRPYFPEGKDSPDICFIKVTGRCGEYWDYSGPFRNLTYYWEAGKAIIQGEKMRPETIGAHHKVDLQGSAPRVVEAGATPSAQQS